MPTISLWSLFVVLSAVWLLVLVTEVVGNRVKSPTNPGSVSIMPAFPFMPLVFVGIAVLADAIVFPWGTRIVLVIHLIGGLIAIAYTVKGIWVIRRR